MLLNCFALLLCASCYCSLPTPKIAIVGAGIGGTTCSHYLRELFGAEAEIDMYEAGPIGGRLATITIEGAMYESGGSIIHPSNAYMLNFTHMLGLKPRDTLDGRLGLFDGYEMVLDGSSWSQIMAMQLLWRYGWDILRIEKYVHTLIHEFMRIYKHQNNGYAFTTVENLLSSMSSQIVDLMHTSTKEAMKKEGFSKLFINEIVRAAMRSNYGQDEHITGLVGSISMAGIQPGLWSVHGGNKRVPEELVLRTKVNLIRSKVTTVTLLSPAPNTQYRLHSEDRAGAYDDRNYDVVVVATPLNDFISEIAFEHFPQNFPTFPQHFHTTYATFLKGVPNVDTFGLRFTQDFPSNVLTTESLFFSSIGRQQPVDFVNDGAYKYNSVYKVFSNAPLNSTQLNTLFITRDKLTKVVWRAYPEYDGAAEYDRLPFELHDHLYYVNGIEVAGSSMEMSAIGGRNVAQLAYNRWRKRVDKVDSMDVLKNHKGNEEL